MSINATQPFILTHMVKDTASQEPPQGLKNSPLFLKLMMDKMFASSDLLKHVIYYADDRERG